MTQCPGCKLVSETVYIGLNDVECPTPGCPHFNQQAFEAKQDQITDYMKLMYTTPYKLDD